LQTASPFRASTPGVESSRLIRQFDRLTKKLRKGYSKMHMKSDDIKILSDLLDKKLAPLQKDIHEVKQDVSGLKEDVRGLKKDMSALKQDVSVLKRDMKEVKKDVKSLIVTTSHILQNAVTKEEFDGLEKRVSILENN